jgi:hypothetical protein
LSIAAAYFFCSAVSAGDFEDDAESAACAGIEKIKLMAKTAPRRELRVKENGAAFIATLSSLFDAVFCVEE